MPTDESPDRRLRAALAWALGPATGAAERCAGPERAGVGSLDRGAAGLRLAAAPSRFWRLRGHAPEGAPRSGKVPRRRPGSL